MRRTHTEKCMMQMCCRMLISRAFRLAWGPAECAMPLMQMRCRS